MCRPSRPRGSCSRAAVAARRGRALTQGDSSRLGSHSADAFAGTPQPVPGRCVEGQVRRDLVARGGLPDHAGRGEGTGAYTGLGIFYRALCPTSVGRGPSSSRSRGRLASHPIRPASWRRPRCGSRPASRTSTRSSTSCSGTRRGSRAGSRRRLGSTARRRARTPRSATPFARWVGATSSARSSGARRRRRSRGRTTSAGTTEESPGAAPTSGANADGDEPAGLASSPVATEQAGDGGLSPWLLGGFAAAGALLATSALVYLLRRRRTRAL